MVVVVVVSFCGRVVVVVVLVSLGGGGEEEEKTKQPDSAEEKQITAISLCSIGGLTSTFEFAMLSGAREAIFSPSHHTSPHEPRFSLPHPRRNQAAFCSHLLKTRPRYFPHPVEVEAWCMVIIPLERTSSPYPLVSACR